MSETTAKLVNQKQDSRIPCRYGDKCYQKNPAHLAKYKHPAKNTKRKHHVKIKPSKRVKLDEAEDEENKQTHSLENDSNDEKCVMTTVIQGNNKKECVSSSDSEQDESVEGVCSSDEVTIPPKAQNENRKECVSSSDSEQDDELVKGDCSSNKVTILPKNKNENDAEMPISVQLNDDKEDNSKCPSEEARIDETSTMRPFNPNEFIKAHFLVDLPDDFYMFWDFCKQLKSAAPSEALKDVGLELVGPYDVLAGKFKHIKRSPEQYLQHWRYYYDPPEVLTVVKGNNNTGYHIGYFYDSPEDPPSFLVGNYGTKDGVFTKMGDNIFSAVIFYLEELKKTGDPFKKLHVGKLLALIRGKAEKLQLNLSSHSQKIKKREFKVVAKTFNKIGLVVPYNKKTQLGYRELAMPDKELMVLLTRLEAAAPEQKSKYLSDLQPVLTYANIALDECDFGTGVKLGWELLYHGIGSLNSTISQFLSNSYRLLNKEAFAKIAEAHMSKRRKGCDLSIL